MSALAYAISLIKRWADVAGEDECWQFSKKSFAKSGNGACTYGLVYVTRRRKVRAHRLAYELAFGPLPSGAMVCHRCDNPMCCNPNHLFIGTAADNNEDKMKKGRHYALSGERNAHAKMTDEQAAEAARRARDGESQKALAEEFGVSQPAISRLKKMGGYKPQMAHP